METAKLIAVMLALAFLSESLVEYLFGTAADKISAITPYKWTLMYVSAGVGVGLSIHYGLDVIALLLGTAATWVGVTLTGLIIGRGANFVHQFVSKYIPGINTTNG